MLHWHLSTKLVVVLGGAALAHLWLAGDWDDVPAAAMPTAGAAVASVVAAALPSGEFRMPAPAASRVLPPPETFVAITERPLFTPGRRPPAQPLELSGFEPEAPIPEPALGPAPPAVLFVGSIAEAGRVRALVTDGVLLRTLDLRDEIGGWEVVLIEPRRLVLGQADERLELTIFE